MPARSDLLLSDDREVGDLALESEQLTEPVIRVITRRTAAAENADVKRLLDAGGLRTLITSDPAISSTELRARLTAVGLALEVDRLVSTLYVAPASRFRFGFAPAQAAD